MKKKKKKKEECNFFSFSFFREGNISHETYKENYLLEFIKGCPYPKVDFME